MIVCLCHRISDRDIERAARDGCDSFETLQDDLRVATACGACTGCARETFEHACARPCNRTAMRATAARHIVVHAASRHAQLAP